MRALCATVLATGVMAGGMTGAGAAFAEDAGGLILPGVNNGDCTATIKVTNFTNSTFFQPDWWFEQENDPAMVNATTIPAEMPAPWHESSGIQWPMARWVGDPPLASGLGPGVDGWGNGNLYSRNAQPDGFVTQRTIDLKTVTGAPEPSAEGTKTIWFRIKTGPQTADQLPAPQKLVVEGCRSSSGGLDFGSLSL
ncbi:hypothetical protein [Gordonia sp. C13]|uniref:hypothetical protein n=1 Tax=Gordonia sp. C13 TaxID=2935078 RepID=UPI00200B8566|nr:hypothetical protein [Gordonia sp. C13]MCK8613813.1 hypothetical protein [Gordonia sp. C13]